MLLEGIFLPLTTPIYPDGRLYLRKLEHNVERYSRTPAAGMLVLGGGSEVEGLSDAEARAALESALGAADRAKVMIAGVGRESVAATLERVELAAAAGYDAVAVRGPEFSADPAMHRELMTYFQAVADRSALPLMLVSERSRTLGVQALGGLAGHPQVIGAIEAETSAHRLAELLALTAGVQREVTVTTVFAAVTGRMLRYVEPREPAAGGFVSAESLSAGGSALAVAPPSPSAPQLKTRRKRVGFQVLAGSTAGMLEAWKLGATGGVPRLGACAPQACCEVYQAFRDGDLELAAEKQLRIAAAGERMEGWAGVAATKHGCDLNGYFGGRPRLPLLALTAEQRARVEREMAGLKN